MTGPRRLGGFELHDKLGSGAMATVYRGVQLSLGREVVLKIIHPHLAEDPGLVARFEREARAAAHLRHENIVQVIDCGKIDDTPFIAMEFVHGVDLKHLIETHGVPPIEMTILMLRDICRGLQHAHEHGVIHRDIKPANLMITPTGTIKIMDFGLARRAEDSVAMTVAGSIMGTPAYMSPEQATGLKVDERSDLFTVGIVGYELLTGHRPFHGDTYSAVLNAILTQEPAPLRTQLPGVPEDLANLIHRALEKEPSARPPKIADLREVLETLVARLGLARGEDLLRHYAGNPEAVARKLRERAPGETVESVLLGTLQRPAADRNVVETRMGLETIPPTVPPRSAEPPVEAPPVAPSVEASRPAAASAPPEPPPVEAPPAASPPPPPRPMTPAPRPVAPRPVAPAVVDPQAAAGRRRLLAMIGGGVAVAAVAIVLGLQFLKPPPPLPDPNPDPDSATHREPVPRPKKDPDPDTIHVPVPVPKKDPDPDTKHVPVPVPKKDPDPVPKRPPDPDPKRVPEPAPKAASHRYRVSSIPNATITIDGRKVEFAQVVTLTVGTHRLKAENPTMNLRGEFTYTVTADDTNNVLILNLRENRLDPKRIRDLPF